MTGRPGCVAYWSGHSIKRAFSAWADEHGQPPIKREWEAAARANADMPSITAILNRFGSWNNAIREAGLVPRKGGESSREPQVALTLLLPLSIYEPFERTIDDGEVGLTRAEACRQAVSEWTEARRK